MKTPRYDADQAPICQVGMGVEAARLNGYKHGFQGVESVAYARFRSEARKIGLGMRGSAKGKRTPVFSLTARSSE